MSHAPNAYLHPASPPSASQGRPSSRRALTKALELAQEAVRIDASGDDPQGAVIAYARSVALLNEVMERVMRGEDTDSGRRRNPGRRKSVVAKEDEARRLRSIHDTYYDRMQILIMIFGLPPPEIPGEPPSAASTHGDDDPSTPPAQPRPDAFTMETPVQIREHVLHEDDQDEEDESFDVGEGIGSAMLASTATPSPRAPEPVDYASYQSSRPPPPQPQLLTRTTALPPMRQPPFGLPPSGPPPFGHPPSGPPPSAPLPLRPRADSLLARHSRLGPPSLPPPMPLPPPPSSAYDLSTPVADTYNQTAFTHESRHNQLGQALNDTETIEGLENVLGSAADRLVVERPEDQPKFRRLPPVPRRKNTSDSEGSLTRHHLPTQVPGGAPSPSLLPPPQHQEPELQAHPYAAPRPQDTLEELRSVASRPPTPASRSRGNTQSSVASSQSSMFDRPRTPPPIPQLVSSSTAQGTISQRRKVGGPTGIGGGGSSASLEVAEPQTHAPLSRSHSPANLESSSAPVASSRLTAAGLPLSTAASLGITTAGRHRAASQPGRRPSLVGLHGSSSSSEHELAPAVPPLPQSALPKKTSFTNIGVPQLTRQDTISTTSGSGHGHQTLSLGIPPTPGLTASTTLFSPGVQTIPPIPNSPLPGPPPSDTLRRPYHLMSLLHTSIASPSGGYLTRRLHVPHDVWTQGGAKLNNLVEKGKCIAFLEAGLDDLSKASQEFIRSGLAGNDGASQGLTGQGIARAVGERWVRALDEWLSTCDSAIANVGKKLGLGEGLVKKGAGWGIKVTRTFDRMTNGKNLDSPTVYVQNLASLFSAAQVFDEHHRLLSSPGGCYGVLPPDTRAQIETRLKRTSEFFVSVVLVFVIRDLGQLLDKYAKKGERWMEE